MAAVHEARHVQLGKRVAIKVLHPHLAGQKQTVARFVREGRAAASIRHPHVVEVFEIGDHDGVPFLVMDLLDGIDLATHLRDGRRMSPTEIADIMLPVVSAIAAAHDCGTVHRDLKPGNILLGRGRGREIHPTVIDFGISKVAGEMESLTQTESMLGTLSYMAPEHARSPKAADARSDQYSLGVILYECATGQKPFSADAWYDLMHAILTAPLVPPREIVPELPEAFDDIVTRAMSRRAADRYGSTRSLGRALLPFASERVQQIWGPELSSAESMPRVASAAQPDEPLAAALGGGGDVTDIALTHAPEAERSRRTPAARGVRIAIAAAVAGAAIAAIVGSKGPRVADLGPATHGAATLLQIAQRRHDAVPTASPQSIEAPTPAPTSSAPAPVPLATRAGGRPHLARPSASPSAKPRADVSFGTNDAPIVE